MDDFENWGERDLKAYLRFAADCFREPRRSTNVKDIHPLVFQAHEMHNRDPTLVLHFLKHPQLHRSQSSAPDGANAGRTTGVTPQDPLQAHTPPEPSAATPWQRRHSLNTAHPRQPAFPHALQQGYLPATAPNHTLSVALQQPQTTHPHQQTSYPPPAMAIPHASPAPQSAFTHPPAFSHDHPPASPPTFDSYNLQGRMPSRPLHGSLPGTGPPLPPGSSPPHLMPPPIRTQLSHATSGPPGCGYGDVHYMHAHPSLTPMSSAPASSTATYSSADAWSPRTSSSCGAAAAYPPAAAIHQSPHRPVYASHAAPEPPRAPPHLPAPPHQPPPAGPGRKRALLIGCCYPNSETDRVRGACHDVECMRDLLCGLFRFRPEDVCMLVDVPTPSLPKLRPETVPTRANILREMTRLVHGVQAGDSLFFHFSGHGDQIPDDSSIPEPDGMNETLCPTDFRSQGQIADDIINTVLIRPLPTGVRLHALVDACHSGTSMDLRYNYVYDHASGGAIRTVGESKEAKGTSGGFAAMFSACDDSQLAADTVSFGGLYHTGVATSCFVEACFQIHAQRNQFTYLNILREMSKRVREYEKGRSERDRRRRRLATAKEVIGRLLGRPPPTEAPPCQTPQLSVSSESVPSSCTANVGAACFLDHIIRI